MQNRLQTGADIIPLWTYRTTMDMTPLNEMQSHWAQLQAGRLVPLRSEIDPRAIAGTLETGFIVERTQPGMVRFRLAGLALCDLMGMEVRGMPLRSFIAPAVRADFSAQLEQVFDGPEVHEYSLISESSTTAPLMARMLILPLKSDTGEIDRAIGCIVTEGVVGLSPRRFRVLETTVTSLVTGRTTITAAQERLAAFTQDQSPFHARPIVPKTEDGRPMLRIVKSDVED